MTAYQLGQLEHLSFFFHYYIHFYIQEPERPQMSDFPDGYNQDAIITMLITTRGKRGMEETI